VLRRERNEAVSQLQLLERELAVARERNASLVRQEKELSADQEQQLDAVAVAIAHVGAVESELEK